MKGKITKYVEDKGYGFILDEKGKSRFFHVSDVSDPLEVSQGLRVTFNPEESTKGGVAKSILISKEALSPQNKFINIGGTRLKISNIKQYGTSSRTETEEYKIEHEAEGFFENAVDIGSILLSLIPTDGAPLTRGTVYSGTETKKTKKNIKYLYITTYQGDNYNWDEDEINIVSTMAKLDRV
jgi:cold shock CspA family protein